MTELPSYAEVWWCDHPDIGRRPVLVLSRDAAIRARRRAIVGPCTTQLRHLPSEVVLDPADDPVPLPCAVHLDSLESVPAGWLTERLGRVSDATMRAVCNALTVAIPCP